MHIAFIFIVPSIIFLITEIVALQAIILFIMVIGVFIAMARIAEKILEPINSIRNYKTELKKTSDKFAEVKEKLTFKKEVKKESRVIKGIVKKIESITLKKNGKKILVIFTCLIGMLFVAIFTITKQLGASIISVIMIATTLHVITSSLYDRQQKRISEQIPVFLNSLSNALKAGYSFIQGLEFITPELPFPLRHYLEETIKRMELGESMEESFSELKKKLHHEDMNFVVDSSIIQIKSGGDIISFFKKLSHSIQERIKLENDLKTATSQGKLSAIIIALLWPISLLIFFTLSPDYIGILFTTTIGKALLYTSLMLEVIGFYFIYKITKVPL